MKILYLDPVVGTLTSQNYKYYNGVYDALGPTALHRGCPRDMGAFLENVNFSPDIIIFGLGWFSHKYFGKIDNIKVPTICYLFKPQNDLAEKLDFCKINNIDTIITPVPASREYEKITGVPTKLFPYGFDPKVFYRRGNEKKYDIGFSGALHQDIHYPSGAFKSPNLRSRVHEKLCTLKDLEIFWQASDDRPARIASYEAYANTLDSAKIWIATQAAYGDITPRFFEVLGSGALLLCEEIPPEYNHILQDGINCVQFDGDLHDFEVKARYYLNNREELDRIVNNAYTFFHENYTWERRAAELLDICEELL